ncbi:MAG: hypothetical protein RBR48_06075 [Bacilli bacterium]|jgi:hypothetical protein|nr:hypothetical protein [Bacilli bacterium]MDD4056403.1 hypothetical protein [Bacilli bacterium]MDY0209724.1 hypothetical protein [Bacilli bacterium]
MEEPSYLVSKNHIEFAGKIKEKHKGKMEDIFILTSRYYYCEFKTTIPNTTLDNYQVGFLDLGQALTTNLKKDSSGCLPWVK